MVRALSGDSESLSLVLICFIFCSRLANGVLVGIRSAEQGHCHQISEVAPLLEVRKLMGNLKEQSLLDAKDDTSAPRFKVGMDTSFATEHKGIRLALLHVCYTSAFGLLGPKRSL